ncbi:MAG: anaerobic ribonucleoside-triphosphate reductase activating protein [Selenomonadaceae bacterium]|nr:anaerobic ribonucleoside-triphosphate reductase activating protein [Selenomonadaceae bacterium]
MNNGFLRVAGIVEESIVDGDGLRFSLFLQGCKRACPGCHNKNTWDLNGGSLISIDEITERITSNPLLTGVTFSGGEPFLQAENLIALAKKIRKENLNLWCYTGNTYEEILEKNDKHEISLLDEIDVLVDGEYIEHLRDLTLKFRGSKNQRVIDLNETKKTGRIVLKYE